MNTPDPISHLRQLSPTELEDVGQRSLREHLQAQAIQAHQMHGPLTFEVW